MVVFTNRLILVNMSGSSVFYLVQDDGRWTNLTSTRWSGSLLLNWTELDDLLKTQDMWFKDLLLSLNMGYPEILQKSKHLQLITCFPCFSINLPCIQVPGTHGYPMLHLWRFLFFIGLWPLIHHLARLCVPFHPWGEEEKHWIIWT